MAVWMITFSLFWVVLTELVSRKHLSLGKYLNNFVQKNRDLLITLTVGLIAILLYFRWADYWNSLL